MRDTNNPEARTGGGDADEGILVASHRSTNACVHSFISLLIGVLSVQGLFGSNHRCVSFYIHVCRKCIF